MNTFVQLTEQADPVTAGRKAASAGRMRQAGFPIPPGLCLTTEAFKLSLGGRSLLINSLLQEGQLTVPDQAQAAADKIETLLSDLAVPPVIAAELRHFLPQIGDPETPMAVRSSATAEDWSSTSFAGQYVTVLGVRSEAALLSAVLACWRSFFNAHALSARATAGALGKAEAMAILIQPMIAAECAGVCFSIDPIRPELGRMIVTSTWGLGLAVADGSASADSAWLGRDGFRLLEQQVQEKKDQIILHPEGGLQRVALSKACQRSACLPESWLRRLAQFSLAAEQLFGRPQEIEWAVAGNRVWVLQSRPIANLPPEIAIASHFPVDLPNGKLWQLYDLSGREKSALLPLEQEYLAELESIREETCRFMGADANGEIAFFNGRPYFSRLPINVSEADRRVRQNALADLRERLRQQGRTAWDYWGPEIEKAVERLSSFDLDEADGPALAGHLEEALAVRRRHGMLHPMVWFKPDQRLFDALVAVSGLPLSEAKIVAYQLLDGEDSPLTRIIDGLYDLAQIARRSAALEAVVRAAPADVLDRLTALQAPECPLVIELMACLDSFLSVYGERNGAGYGSEATITTPTWREQPEQIFQLAARFLDPSVEPPASARKRARLEREAHVDRLCANAADPQAVDHFRRELAYARKAFTVLEEHNHTIDQIGTGQVRQAILAATRLLVSQGILASQDDVFWLTFDEVLAALRGQPAQDLAGTIKARRAQHVEWLPLEPPPILGVPEAWLPERPPQATSSAVTNRGGAGWPIRGLGASPGLARGRARIVNDLTSVPDLSPGDVLVAANAGPLWTPFFPILAGLVLDGGSLGQHAAATAREYGLPAVVATGNATGRIPDGALIIVDGTQGLVDLDKDIDG